MPEEVILALELYQRDEITPSDIQELSDTLRAWPVERHLAAKSSFRNPSSVRSKLYNLEYLDTKGKRGRKNAGEATEKVWRELGSHRADVLEAAADIRAAINQAASNPAALAEDKAEFEAKEGSIVMRIHRMKERSSRLVREKKDDALSRTGRLQCEACGFDSNAAYGVLGIIDCHHLIPVSELTPGSTTSLDDMRLLCPNCHRLVHSRRPWMDWAELLSVVSGAQ